MAVRAGDGRFSSLHRPSWEVTLYLTIRTYQTSPQAVDEILCQDQKSFLRFIHHARGFRNSYCLDAGKPRTPLSRGAGLSMLAAPPQARAQDKPVSHPPPAWGCS